MLIFILVVLFLAVCWCAGDSPRKTRRKMRHKGGIRYKDIFFYDLMDDDDED